MRKIFMIAMLCLVPKIAIARPTVVVSLPVQEYFANEIAGESIAIQVLLKKGYDPHTYEPSPKDLITFSKARYFLTVGLAIEKKWQNTLEKLYPQLKTMNIFLASPEFQSLLHTMKIHQHKEQIHSEHMQQKHHEHSKDTHHKGDEHDHHNHNEHHHNDHEEKHLWLSPLYIRIMLQNMTYLFTQLIPEKKAEYYERMQILQGKIEKLQQQITNTLKTKKNRTFLSYHPVWEYFAKEFNLEEIPIEENLREPSVATVHRLIETAKKKHIPCIFTQANHTSPFATLISKELSIPVITLDPLQKEWFELMETFLGYLNKYLQ